MQKKTEIHDLEIPQDDIECWERYPKHHWVYDLSRLLDAQNIKWSPFRVDGLADQVPNLYLKSNNNIAYMPGRIFISNATGRQLYTEAYIIKGEIKYIRYFCNSTKKIITEDVGNIELRINAFVSIHFQKFTGVISAETIGTDIYSIRLRPLPELALVANTEVSKIIKEIYKKNDIEHITGLTDHLLHETIAS